MGIASGLKFKAPMAWTAETLDPKDGHLTLSEHCITELRALTSLIKANPVSTLTLSPKDFNLQACRKAMKRAKHLLAKGPGFVLIDRLPLEEMTRVDAVSAYWVLSSLLGRPVAQKWDGSMIYEVSDCSGQAPGNGIRPDITNAEQGFHTDNAYNLSPPDYVALLCLHPAKLGGISRIVNLNAAHELMRRHHPSLLPRLYKPYIWDRQMEHRKQDDKFLSRPVFAVKNAGICARLGNRLIRQGYTIAKAEMDEEGRSALEALYTILDDRSLYKEFLFKPGQIQIVDNQFIGHKRTSFEDWPEKNRKRRLVRLWIRNGGKVFYNG